MNSEQPAPSTVCAVVVTYHPDERVVELLSAVARQVDQVIVVDNGSTAVETGPIRGWAESAGATWIANETNVGSATALNQAARAARSAGHGWLLTLDQDTTVPGDLVALLRAAIAADAEPERVAIAAPQTEHQEDRRCRDRDVIGRRMAITSGSLMSLAAWEAVGGFRDEFFIDMVEADFALRLARHSYRVILACRVSIGHRIGQPRTRRILGRVVETSNHPPWRRYYISRNRVHVWREHWRVAPVWVLFDGYGELRDTVVMALTEDDRRRKLRATARGLADGLRGRLGPRVKPPDSSDGAASGGPMAVRVGIVSWETAAHLERCLDALPAALGSLTAEVVVVDNASRDDSAEIARSRGATVVANSRNVGFARAMNVALAGTSAPFLIALNPDTEPRPLSLERLVRRLRHQPRLGLVAPRLLNVDGSVQHSVHRFPSVTLALVMGLVPFTLRRGPLGRHFWLHGFADHRRRQSIDWAIGAVHAVRRAALADPEHAYPERTFMYGEDVALCWELHQTGWEVSFEPAAEVVHVGGVAARRAFGDTIDARKLAADYDWFRSARGAAQARLWAAANMLGYGSKLAVARLIWPADDPRTRRTRKFLRLHARRLHA